MKILGGSASLDLAQDVADILQTKLSSVDIHIFPDGERRIRITEQVVDEECVVIQSAPPPVDTNYMELFFLIDALKRSGAEKVTAVVPYFGYQRQDHVFREGEAVSLEVVIRILESLNIDRLVSVDMHTPKIPDLFHIPVSHISALPLFAKTIKEHGWDTPESVLISPDMGGIGRIKKLSELLGGMAVAAVEKNRDLETGSLQVSSFGEGSVTGKKQAIIVDDMIASGKTIALASAFLHEQGIEEIHVFATHAVFSEDAPHILEGSFAKEIFITDTVRVSAEKQFSKLSVLSSAPIIAAGIKDPVSSNSPLLSL